MARQEKLIDLTQGRPITQLLRFSFPLVLGTLFQQLYSFVDTVMVGRFIGTNALAAVGATYSLHFLVLGFVQGACVGFCIPLAMAFGAKDGAEFKRYFWNGAWLCAAVSVVGGLGASVLANPLLRLINTPQDIFAQASLYIILLFAGIPFSVLYNYSAGALRAAGDSRHPFYFLLFSSLLNIVLDYICIVPLGMGVAGAAIATVASQGVSGLLNLYWLARRTTLLQGSGGLRGLSGRHIRRLCVVGFPMGFEYSISAIGAVVMQGAINGLGSAAVAGQTAGEKIRQLFTLPMESVGMGMATYAGQNDGARRTDRICAGIRAGLTIQWSYCAAAWVVIFFGKRAFTGLVLGTTTGEIAELSIRYLTIISVLFFLHGALMIMRNTLQGMGYSTHAVLSGMGELAGRSVGSLLAARLLGFDGICLANPLAWGIALAYCCITVWYFIRKRQKTAASA